MQKTLVALAILLCSSSVWATPPTGAAEGEPTTTDDAGARSTPAVTRTVALWTHGITGAASLVGSAVYGIRGLQKSSVSKYKDECESGVTGGCERYEATERERRVDQEIGGALLLYSAASLSNWVFLGSTDPARIDPSNGGAASVLYGTSAALSAATAGLFVYTLKLRSDFSDPADACFDGNCSQIQDAASDVNGSLAVPLIVTGINYVVSMSTTLWLWWTGAELRDVSLAPVLDPNYTGATLTGRF